MDGFMQALKVVDYENSGHALRETNAPSTISKTVESAGTGELSLAHSAPV